ncbi:hypothetical protein TIFTF001_022559 [Ficus carica]|uniref:Uncharacterized protein n=1 Tax=Ficus carica TaxID=3494 RepID=A0AA88AIV1_FICCA|nr:hypothetical protein TIFTF001_022559 [Ficus carica]
MAFITFRCKCHHEGSKPVGRKLPDASELANLCVLKSFALRIRLSLSNAETVRLHLEELVAIERHNDGLYNLFADQREDVIASGKTKGGLLA